MHSMEVHPLIREYIAGLVAKKKEIGKNDEQTWQSVKEKACIQFWLDLLNDRKLCEDVVSYSLENEAKCGADIGIPLTPPVWSLETLELSKRFNQLGRWLWREHKECATSLILAPSVLRDDNQVDEIAAYLESVDSKANQLKFKYLNLADSNQTEHRNRCRYLMNKIDLTRQKDPNRLFIAAECGNQAYPFAMLGFDVINTSFTGFEKEGGGRKHQKEFVGYSAYYSKDDLIHIPYTRLYHQTFPSHGGLPCDHEVCISVSSLEGMPRDYWNFMIARPHYGLTWDGFLTEMSDYINTKQVQKAKQRLIFSELCALKSLIPDV